jgi:hypothetical protein
MDATHNEALIDEINIIDNADSLHSIDNKDMNLRQKNLRDLKTLQKIYFMYEDEVLSIDEVLERVLEFYGKFVPYKSCEEKHFL